MDRVFNVIRIPIKYTKQMDILTEKQQLYIYKSLGAIGRGEIIEQRESMEFYILCNIFEEWMSMESKNGNKSEKSLTKYLSELPAQVEPSNPGAIVQYSIVKDNIVQDSKTSEIKIYEDSSFEYIITKLFIDKHKEVQNASFIYLYNKEGEDKLIQKWSDVVRKLKNIDNYTEEQITFIIKYLFTNNFWVENISSMEKLRKKDKTGVPYFVLLINEAKKEKQESIKKPENNGYNGDIIYTDEI